MAKVPKKENKVDQVDLENLTKAVESINTQTYNLGKHELQKAKLIAELAKTNSDFQQMQQMLEYKYGKVSIDVETGEYKEIGEVKE